MAVANTAEELKKQVPNIKQILHEARMDDSELQATLSHHGLNLDVMKEILAEADPNITERQKERMAIAYATDLVAYAVTKQAKSNIYASPETIENMIKYGRSSGNFSVERDLTQALPFIKGVTADQIRRGSASRFFSTLDRDNVEVLGEKFGNDPEMKKFFIDSVVDDARKHRDPEVFRRIPWFLGDRMTPEEAKTLIHMAGDTNPFSIFPSYYGDSATIHPHLMDEMVKDAAQKFDESAPLDHLLGARYYDSSDHPTVGISASRLLKNKAYDNDTQRANLVKLMSVVNGPMHHVSREDMNHALDNSNSFNWYNVPIQSEPDYDVLHRVLTESKKKMQENRDKHADASSRSIYLRLINDIAQTPNPLIGKEEAKDWLMKPPSMHVPSALFQNLNEEDFYDVLKHYQAEKDKGFSNYGTATELAWQNKPYPYPHHMPFMWEGATGKKLDIKKVAQILKTTPEDLSLESFAKKGPKFLWIADSDMRANGVSNGIIQTPYDLEKTIPYFSRGNIDIVDILQHPQIDSDVLNAIKNHRFEDDKTAFDIRRIDGTGTHFYTGWDLLRRMYPYDEPRGLAALSTRSSGANLLNGRYGDETHVKVGSAALRKLRDYLEDQESKGVFKTRPEDLPKGETWNSIVREITDRKGNVNYVADWTPLREPSGYLSKKAVEKHIDSMPTSKFVVTDDHRWEHRLQNTLDVPNEVLMVNLHPETAQRIKDAGLWDAFNQIGTMNVEGGNPAHPAGPTTIGWIRYNKVGVGGKGPQFDNEKPEILMQEIQTDMHNNYRKKMNDVETRYADKQKIKRVWDMIFGGHNPPELLHETAMQHFRNKGMHDYDVHMYDLKSKAKISLSDQQDQPAHFKDTYEKIPKKMGAVIVPQDKSYIHVNSKSSHRDNPDISGNNITTMKVRKFEELLLDLAKVDW